jgi:hypothetical protein
MEDHQEYDDFGNIGSKGWNRMEKTLDGLDSKVVKALDNLSNGIKILSISDTYQTFGEDIYLSLVRPNLNNIRDKIVTILKKEVNNENTDDSEEKDKKKIKKHNKKGLNGKSKNKKQEIIELNRNKKIIEVIENDIKKPLMMTVFETSHGICYNSDYIDVKGCALLVALYDFTNTIIDKTKKSFYTIMTLIASTQRFIKRCDNLVCNNVCVSKTLLDDLQIQLNKLEYKYPFNGLFIYNNFPQVLVSDNFENQFSAAIPLTTIVPREHQQQLVKHIITAIDLDKGVLIQYRAPVSSGKTIASRCIARLVEKERTKPDKKNMQLVFVCNVIAVRDEVARVMVDGGIKIGIASMTKTGDVKIKNQFLCKTDEDRTVIIASPDLAYKILSDCSVRDNTILYFDEPTVGADDVKSKQLFDNMMLLTNSCKITILSSATLPESSEINIIINNYTDVYPDAKIINIISNEIYVGCDIFNYNKEYILPHLNIKTSDELKKIIDSIMKTPFLGRLYTGPALQHLYLNMLKNNITNVPNINELFKDVNNMNANKIRELAMTLLNILLSYPDDIIENVCKYIEHKHEHKIEKQKSDDPFIFEDIDEDIDDDKDDDKLYLHFEKLGTTDAHKFTGSTIIVTSTPLIFAKTNFKQLLDDISYDDEFKQSYIDKYMKKIELDFKRNIDSHKESIDKLDKKVKNEILKSKQIQEIEDNRCKLKFGVNNQINTFGHMKSYTKLINNNIRTSMNLEDLFNKLEFSKIQSDVKALLFCGVGIYTKSAELDDIYLNVVLELASSGLLAYLISDSSLCYGTNYPLNRVIICDDYADKHSMFNIIQYMGRSGRLGKSWSAEVFVSVTLAQRIIEFSHSLKGSEIESQNMCDVFDKCLIKKMEYEELQIKNALSLLDFDFSDDDDIVTNISEYITDVKIKDEPIIKEKEKETEIALDWTTMDDDMILPMVKTKIDKPTEKNDETDKFDKPIKRFDETDKFDKPIKRFEKFDKKNDDTIPNKKVLSWRKE